MKDEQYVAKLVDAARRIIVRDVVDVTADPLTVARLSHRPTMELIKGVTALSAVAPELVTGSDADGTVMTGLKALVRHLTALQLDGGLFSGGDNLVSPPDSAFTLNDVCLTLELLDKVDCPAEITAAVREPLFAIARKAAPAMLTGGIHTPNHRWEISGALVGLGMVLREPALTARAHQWLAEHIDIQPDGLYSERSPLYASHVSNPSLVSMARRLPEPEFLDMVRRNLIAIAALMQPDGSVETVQSRRQDQFASFDPEPFLSQARLLAVTSGDGTIAAFAAELSSRPITDPARHLAEYLVDPRVGETLPATNDGNGTDDVPAVVDFAESRLSRVRLDGTVGKPRVTASVYAGSDFNATYRVASGLANNATLVDFHTPQLTVTGVRIAPDFFDIGPLRPDAIERDGLTWTMRETRTSGYYQPLSAEECREDGSYPMSYEGRFFAQMAYDRRHRDDMSLESTVETRVRPDGFDLAARFEGPHTSFACKIGVAGEGLQVVSGVETIDGELHALAGQDVVMRAGDTELVISHGEEQPVAPSSYDPGETVTYVGGNDRMPGTPIVFSGLTSGAFTVSVTFRGIE